MSSAKNPEIRTREKLAQKLVWETVEIFDSQKLIGELLEFWSRQSQTDAYNRFCSSANIAEINWRYHHAFKYTRFALTLRDDGRLVGFALGTVSPDEPDWVEISVEVDSDYRNQGYGVTSLEQLYLLSLQNGYYGVVAEALCKNHASRAAIARLSQGKPCEVSCQSGMARYYIGDLTFVPVSLDLL